MVLIGINTTETDKEIIRQAAQRKGLKIAPYIRSIILETIKKEHQERAIKEDVI